MTTSKLREERRTYLASKIHELYSNGKKSNEIAEALGIHEARVRYYINSGNKKQ